MRSAKHDHRRTLPLPQYPLGHPLVSVVLLWEIWPIALHTIAQDDLEEQEVIALLGLRLTPCQWSILRLLLAHPLLSDEELAAFLSLQRKSVRCSLYELHQLGCLEPIPT